MCSHKMSSCTVEVYSLLEGYWPVIDLKLATSGEVSRGEKMVLRGTDLESYITDDTLLYEDK